LIRARPARVSDCRVAVGLDDELGHPARDEQGPVEAVQGNVEVGQQVSQDGQVSVRPVCERLVETVSAMLARALEDVTADARQTEDGWGLSVGAFSRTAKPASSGRELGW